MALNSALIRARFPSLLVTDGGKRRIYFDNPGGTQVPDTVIERTSEYFRTMNANVDGTFSTARMSQEILHEAHVAMAALLNAPSPDEIVFGQNMTSLTFSMSRSIGRTLKAGDEIILTRMDHDANISPWLWLAEDLGLVVRWLEFDPETCRYRMDQLGDLVNERTRLAAVNYASNAVGTINDVRAIGEIIHKAGGLIYVDAVQYVPHAPTDVQELGCDFLLCSAYKFFGPHQGILWGKRSLLESLFPYKVRPAKNRLPNRFETGTLSHEGLAGTLAAVEYLEWLGESMAQEYRKETAGRTGTLHAAMRAIDDYEKQICYRLISGIQAIHGLHIYGIVREDEMTDRVPTVSFTSDVLSPIELSEQLGQQNIFSWEGDYYAQEVIRTLGLSERGGILRVGLAHYNTAEEVDEFLNALELIQTNAKEK